MAKYNYYNIINYYNFNVYKLQPYLGIVIMVTDFNLIL